MKRAVLILTLFAAIPARGAGINDYYKVENIAAPKGLDVQVGGLTFLPDGRLFIALQNQEPLDVDLEITLAGFDGGKVLLQIPPGGINLSYQSASIQ